jgi:hypothetical protein
MKASEGKRRWFYPQPVWLVVFSLATTGFLFFSERGKWFAFNQYKGWTVLIAVASVVAVLAVMLLWWLAAFVFRWRFQFSIRSLLVLVIAVAIPCSWLAAELRKAKDQRNAVESFESIGGSVLYDWQELPAYTSGPFPPKPQPPGANWLRSIVGVDFLSNVDGITLDQTNVTDTGLENLRGLTGLYCLSLPSTQVTDAGLENVKGLTSLEYLDLNDTRVTDAGLKRLRGLAALQALQLNDTEVSDAGLENFRALTALQQLSLNRTKITDAGLENLKRLTALQYLELNDTRVTDVGLDNLRELMKLDGLWLEDAPQVTDAGVKRLQQALPNCIIHH